MKTSEPLTPHSQKVDRLNRENKRRLDAHNRGVDQQNKKAVSEFNRQVRRVNDHNGAVIADLNRQLRASSSGPRYTTDEQVLADRVQHALPGRDSRNWDTFLSYARIDGAEIGDKLRHHLEQLGVTVWFDEIAITPGKSQARQMDAGLQRLAQASLFLPLLISWADSGPNES